MLDDLQPLSGWEKNQAPRDTSAPLKSTAAGIPLAGVVSASSMWPGEAWGWTRKETTSWPRHHPPPVRRRSLLGPMKVRARSCASWWLAWRPSWRWSICSRPRPFCRASCGTIRWPPPPWGLRSMPARWAWPSQDCWFRFSRAALIAGSASCSACRCWPSRPHCWRAHRIWQPSLLCASSKASSWPRHSRWCWPISARSTAPPTPPVHLRPTSPATLPATWSAASYQPRSPIIWDWPPTSTSSPHSTLQARFWSTSQFTAHRRWRRWARPNRRGSAPGRSIFAIGRCAPGSASASAFCSPSSERSPMSTSCWPRHPCRSARCSSASSTSSSSRRSSRPLWLARPCAGSAPRQHCGSPWPWQWPGSRC